MGDQPFDGSIPFFDDFEFYRIDDSLIPFISSQADYNALNHSGSSNLSSLLALPLAWDDLDGISNDNFRSADELFLEDAFPDGILGESSLIDLRDDPIDEHNIASTVHAGNDAIQSPPPPANSVNDVHEPMVEDVPEQTDLESVDIDTQKRLISVIVHPKQDPRRRYAKEGKRRMKKLDDSDLITVDLSQLKKYNLNPNQSLILRLSLISGNRDDDDNPFDNVHIHPDKLRCFSPLMRLNLPNDGSIYICIKQSDIDKGIIELKHLSIIKTKYNMYNFKLISYSLLEIGHESETYTINPKKGTVANAKIFRQRYTLKACRIACQILIKEDKSLEFTHIACATNIMIEQEYDPDAKKPVKRAMKKPVKRAGIKTVKRAGKKPVKQAGKKRKNTKKM